MERVTVVVLTFNEEDNIGRTLMALSEFPEVIVLDSGSTDRTFEIVKRFANARFVVRRFDSHAAQWNFGLSLCGGARDWVLALDADYRMTSAVVNEIRRLEPTPDVGGYRVRFRYVVMGRPLRGAIYPPGVVLYRREGARYEQIGHTQRVVISGRIIDFGASIEHDDRKPMSRWLLSQQRYAGLEADHVLNRSDSQLRWIDKLRRMAWPAPFFVFFYTLVYRRCLLDGWPGWVYVLQRTMAEMIIAVEVADRRLRRRVEID